MAQHVSSKGGGSHGHAPGTPGSRIRGGGRGNESPEMGSTVPKFGGWENDPSSADNFTGIFEKVREEKQGGSAKVPIINDDARYHYGSNHDNSKESSGAVRLFHYDIGLMYSNYGNIILEADVRPRTFELTLKWREPRPTVAVLFHKHIIAQLYFKTYFTETSKSVLLQQRCSCFPWFKK